jgi:peptide/nickel transport system permease protein
MTSSASTSSPSAPPAAADSASGRSPIRDQLRLAVGNWAVRTAIAVIVVLVLLAVFAPWLGTVDPIQLSPGERLKGMSAAHWFGTDSYGRDVYSRVAYGARISLAVGLGATVLSVTLGLAIGLVAGYFRVVDAIIMRVMDGMMAVPGILLAISLVALSGASLFTVLVAISVPEIPRVVRMVRSVILTVRNEAYVEAAITLGTPVPVILWRHMMPNTLSPLIVQSTYIFASAILSEAVLSFLGAGIPPETPSWGNVMAEGRVYFLMLPGLILFPGVLVSLTVLSINVLGDTLRDALDPRMSKRL